MPEEKQHQALGNRKGVNFSGLLKNPESVAVNAVRNASLYCYGMILCTDAHYLHVLSRYKEINKKRWRKSSRKYPICILILAIVQGRG
ncbi:unnamed protein product [Salmonella enterica subsp. enterica serovar Dublin]|nr:unnamed protein product [Salmonella enterica subsp. enterica serovar Dublin]